MSLVSDILLASGALAAAFYCYILSGKLSKLNDLEGGMGVAVAVLSKQVDELKPMIDRAQASAGHSQESLGEMIKKADDSARQLELLIASLHDLPEVSGEKKSSQPEESVPLFSRRQIKSGDYA